MAGITPGAAGDDERMAFRFDATRLNAAGSACELAIPPEWPAEVAPDALTRQFARTS